MGGVGGVGGVGVRGWGIETGMDGGRGWTWGALEGIRGWGGGRGSLYRPPPRPSLSLSLSHPLCLPLSLSLYRSPLLCMSSSLSLLAYVSLKPALDYYNLSVSIILHNLCPSNSN